jgi:hypothetical protein
MPKDSRSIAVQVSLEKQRVAETMLLQYAKSQ